MLRRLKDSKGFTLIELLVVITLLAILSAILTPILIPSPARTLRAAASEVATTLRETRRLAQSRQAHRRFMVDTETERYGIEGVKAWRQLPDGTQAVSSITGSGVAPVPAIHTMTVRSFSPQSAASTMRSMKSLSSGGRR